MPNNDYTTGIRVLETSNMGPESSILSENGVSYSVLQATVEAASNSERYGGTNAADSFLVLKRSELLSSENANKLLRIAENHPQLLLDFANTFFSVTLTQEHFNDYWQERLEGQNSFGI